MTQPLTMQEAFDKIWDWFVVQGKPRGITVDTRSKELCNLRGLGGTRCAVGVLIEDEDYRSDMERIGPVQACARVPYLASLSREFLIACVYMHDDPGFDDLRRRPKMLRTVAQLHGLKVPNVPST